MVFHWPFSPLSHHYIAKQVLRERQETAAKLNTHYTNAITKLLHQRNAAAEAAGSA